MGERPLRELQLEDEDEFQRLDLLLVEGAAGVGGTLAQKLQHRPAALLAGIPPAGPGGMAGHILHRSIQED